MALNTAQLIEAKRDFMDKVDRYMSEIMQAISKAQEEVEVTSAIKQHLRSHILQSLTLKWS